MVILQLEEQPPLIQAVFSGEVETVKKLLESNQDVNNQDFEKRSALHAAAFLGDAMISKLLIDYGARVNTKDCKWVTPLHRACYSGSEETVTILLNHAADTCARDRLWQTPLHIASACNSLECVQFLLDRSQNPNVNVTDRSGRTALHHAVLNGHNDIVELLIARGSIVNACDKKDCRPMHWAAFKGHAETVEILLQHGADINAKDRNQYTPLHVAAASGAIGVIDILVENGANIEAQNAYGNTALHVACLNGHGNFASELVRYKADKEAVNYRGQTALHLAAASTHGVHCLNMLVNQNVDINRQSMDGRTPLHMTAIHGRFTRSKTLIDKGAIVDSVDKNGNSALHIAAQFGHELLSNTLLSYGADPAKKGFEDRTPLHMCCLSGYIECCRIFIKASVDLNDQDNTGKTPLHCAAYKGAVECVDLLVSSGANCKVVDKVGRTALHYAAVQGFYFCVFTLVGIGTPVNQADNEGCTALHLAAAYDVDGRCVNYLIEHKADPKLKDSHGFTPIHYAVACNNVNALKYLLQAVGNYTLYGTEMPPTTPLHIAVRNGNMEILEKLMPYFPDPNIKNERGCTPLLLAARQGFANCVQMLLRFGAKVSICDINNLSPVHHSAKNGHVHCLALLVDNAEDKSIIDLPDNLQRTALMLAVSNSHIDCVTTLLKSGADPNIVDGDLHSCLFRAVVTGQLQLLLPRSTLTNKPDCHGKTILHVAAACGRVARVQAILPYMDPETAEARDNQNFTALHWACYSGSSESVAHFFRENMFRNLEGNLFSPVHCATSVGSENCLQLLCMQYGPDIVKLRDNRSRISSHIAALHGHTDCARFLLEQGADINCQDEDGRTPLISAAYNGQVQVIDILISYKADMTISDKNGNTALHTACLRRHSQAALLLLDFINDPEVINMVNNERKTPLHLTARNGLVDVTRQLIVKGSSLTAVDANGLTPALCCAPNASVAQCLALILANHPLQTSSEKDAPICPKSFKVHAKTSTSTLRPGLNRRLQTDITLLRDPDQFELERMFDLKFRKNSQEDIVADDTTRFFINYKSSETPDFKKTEQESVVSLEFVDKFARHSAFELHSSQSDTVLAPKPIYSEEDYEKMIKKSSENQLITELRPVLKSAKRKPRIKDEINAKKEDTRSKSTSLLTTFRSDSFSDIVPGCNNLDQNKDFVKRKLIERIQTGATPKTGRYPKSTNKRLKPKVDEVDVKDHLDRCQICKQFLNSSVLDEQNIPLETMQLAIEKVLARKGCSTNRCLQAFLDESYELNAKNAHLIYHGMLSPRCEPFIAKHLNLNESELEIFENPGEDGGYTIKKSQIEIQTRYKPPRISPKTKDTAKSTISKNQDRPKLILTKQNKDMKDLKTKLIKEDPKIVEGKPKVNAVPKKLKDVKKTQKNLKILHLPTEETKRPPKNDEFPDEKKLNQTQKVYSDSQKVLATNTKLKKTKNFSTGDLNQNDHAPQIDCVKTEAAIEKIPKNDEKTKMQENGSFPDYLKTLTSFQVDPLMLNEDVRCYPTYWCFPEITDSKDSTVENDSNESPENDTQRSEPDVMKNLNHGEASTTSQLKMESVSKIKSESETSKNEIIPSDSNLTKNRSHGEASTISKIKSESVSKIRNENETSKNEIIPSDSNLTKNRNHGEASTISKSKSESLSKIRNENETSKNEIIPSDSNLTKNRNHGEASTISKSKSESLSKIRNENETSKNEIIPSDSNLTKNRNHGEASTISKSKSESLSKIRNDNETSKNEIIPSDSNLTKNRNHGELSTISKSKSESVSKIKNENEISRNEIIPSDSNLTKNRNHGDASTISKIKSESVSKIKNENETSRDEIIPSDSNLTKNRNHGELSTISKIKSESVSKMRNGNETFKNEIIPSDCNLTKNRNHGELSTISKIKSESVSKMRNGNETSRDEIIPSDSNLTKNRNHGEASTISKIKSESLSKIRNENETSKNEIIPSDSNLTKNRNHGEASTISKIKSESLSKIRNENETSKNEIIPSDSNLTKNRNHGEASTISKMKSESVSKIKNGNETSKNEIIPSDSNLTKNRNHGELSTISKIKSQSVSKIKNEKNSNDTSKNETTRSEIQVMKSRYQREASTISKFKSESVLKTKNEFKIAIPEIEEMLFFNENVNQISNCELGDLIVNDAEIEELERHRQLDEQQESSTKIVQDILCNLQRRAGVMDIKQSCIDVDWCEDMEQFFTQDRRKQLAENCASRTDQISVEDLKRFTRDFSAGTSKNSLKKVEDMDALPEKISAELAKFDVSTIEIPVKIADGMARKEGSVKIHYDNRASTSISSEYYIMLPENKSLSNDTTKINGDISLLDNFIPANEDEHLVQNIILNDSDEFLANMKTNEETESKQIAPTEVVVDEDNFIRKKSRSPQKSSRKKDERGINWKLYMAHRCLQLSDNMNEDYSRKKQFEEVGSMSSNHSASRKKSKEKVQKSDFRKKRSRESFANMKDSFKCCGMKFEEYEGRINIEEIIGKQKIDEPKKVAFQDRLVTLRDQETSSTSMNGNISKDTLTDWQSYIEEGSSCSNNPSTTSVTTSEESKITTNPTTPKSFLEKIDIKDFVQKDMAIFQKIEETDESESVEDVVKKFEEPQNYTKEFAEINSELVKLKNDIKIETKDAEFEEKILKLEQDMMDFEEIEERNSENLNIVQENVPGNCRIEEDIDIDEGIGRDEDIERDEENTSEDMGIGKSDETLDKNQDEDITERIDDSNFEEREETHDSEYKVEKIHYLKYQDVADIDYSEDSTEETSEYDDANEEMFVRKNQQDIGEDSDEDVLKTRGEITEIDVKITERLPEESFVNEENNAESLRDINTIAEDSNENRNTSDPNFKAEYREGSKTEINSKNEESNEEILKEASSSEDNSTEILLNEPHALQFEEDIEKTRSSDEEMKKLNGQKVENLSVNESQNQIIEENCQYREDTKKFGEENLDNIPSNVNIASKTSKISADRNIRHFIEETKEETEKLNEESLTSNVEIAMKPSKIPINIYQQLVLENNIDEKRQNEEETEKYNEENLSSSGDVTRKSSKISTDIIQEHRIEENLSSNAHIAAKSSTNYYQTHRIEENIEEESENIEEINKFPEEHHENLSSKTHVGSTTPKSSVNESQKISSKGSTQEMYQYQDETKKFTKNESLTLSIDFKDSLEEIQDTNSESSDFNSEDIEDNNLKEEIRGTILEAFEVEECIDDFVDDEKVLSSIPLGSFSDEEIIDSEQMHFKESAKDDQISRISDFVILEPNYQVSVKKSVGIDGTFKQNNENLEEIETNSDENEDKSLQEFEENENISKIEDDAEDNEEFLRNEAPASNNWSHSEDDFAMLDTGFSMLKTDDQIYEERFLPSGDNRETMIEKEYSERGLCFDILGQDSSESIPDTAELGVNMSEDQSTSLEKSEEYVDADGLEEDTEDSVILEEEANVYFDTESETSTQTQILKGSKEFIKKVSERSLVKQEIQENLENIVHEKCIESSKYYSQKSVHFKFENLSQNVLPEDSENKSWASLNTIYHADRENDHSRFIESVSDMLCTDSDKNPQLSLLDQQGNHRLPLIEGVAPSEGEIIEKRNDLKQKNCDLHVYPMKDPSMGDLKYVTPEGSFFNKKFGEIDFEQISSKMLDFKEESSKTIEIVEKLSNQLESFSKISVREEASQSSEKSSNNLGDKIASSRYESNAISSLKAQENEATLEEAISLTPSSEICQEIKIRKEEYEGTCGGVQLTQHAMLDNKNDSPKSAESSCSDFKKTVKINRNENVDDNEEYLLLDERRSNVVENKIGKKTFPSVSKLGKKTKKDSNCKIS